MSNGMRAVFPSRAIILLIGIGFLDLVSTAWLYQRGMITERNPLMRPLLENGPWLFVLVKGATLLLAWLMLARYTRVNPRFVRTSCLAGSVAYVGIWTIGFLAGG